MEPKGKIKLNLGCGNDYRPGYVNIDALDEFEPDIVHDLMEPLPFKDSQADEVVAQDILEHFTKENLELFLSEISRVLATGGVLKVRVPNIDDIIERFRSDKETRNEFLYGSTHKTGQFGAHKVGFTKLSLVALMLNNHLELKSLVEEETNYLAEFKKTKDSKKRKLVLVNQTLSTGGAEVFLTDLLSALADLGWEVKVYTNNLVFTKMLSEKGIIVEKIYTIVDIIGDWKGLIKGAILWPFLLGEYLKLIYEERDADLFVSSGFIEKVLLLPLASTFKATTWIEFGPMDEIFKKFYPLVKTLYFLVKSIPERVVTSSDNTKSSLTSVARVSLAKIKVIPCGRDLTPKQMKENQKREDSNLVVCVSRLEPGKGQDLLLEAFKLVKKKVPTAHLRIIGEGDFKNHLEKIINKQKMGDYVELVGRVDNPLSEMINSKVVVFPSVWPLEGFGLVMIEAMSVGRPVVAFKTGPVPEIIENGKTGLLVERANIIDLADKIVTLLKSPSLRKKIGVSAVKKFDQYYRIQSVAESYDQVLAEAINLKKAKTILRQN